MNCSTAVIMFVALQGWSCLVGVFTWALFLYCIPVWFLHLILERPVYLCVLRVPVPVSAETAAAC